jgi:NADPH:quinone reductase-like Zn-dependent oxidoreductase
LHEGSGKGVDVVLESVGGSIFEQALETLAPFGRQVVIGSASNQPSTIASGSLFNHNRAIVGFGIHQYYPKPGLIQETIKKRQSRCRWAADSETRSRLAAQRSGRCPSARRGTQVDRESSTVALVS